MVVSPGEGEGKVQPWSGSWGQRGPSPAGRHSGFTPPPQGRPGELGEAGPSGEPGVPVSICSSCPLLVCVCVCVCVCVWSLLTPSVPSRV